jgi:signal transduction histidine kinase
VALIAVKTPPETPSDEELRAQRAGIRRGLARANTAAVIILLVVVGLAVAAVWEADRALRERAHAVRAEQAARDELWKSYAGEARGLRASPYAGHRFESLEALKSAASIGPSLELRNDAIASLAIADLRLQKILPQSPAIGMAVDAAFERYATADKQGRVQIRRCVDERLLGELPGSTNAVAFIFSFSPDGRYLPVAYNSGDTWVWDLARQEIILRCRAWAFDRTLEFSPDSHQLVVAEAGGAIQLYDFANPSVARTIQKDLRWHRAHFSPDGRLLGIYSETANVVSIKEVATGREVARLMHPGTVLGLAWDPGGQVLATGCFDDRVFLWQIDKPDQPLRAFAGHQSPVSEVLIHPSGQVLASTSWDATTRLWDIPTGLELVRLTPGYTGLRFSRDGQWLGMTMTPENNSIGLYEVTQNRALRFLREPSPAAGGSETEGEKAAAIWQVNFSSDERLLASAGKQGVRVWDLAQGRQLARLTGSLSFSAFFHPDNEHLITSGNEGVLRWRIERAADHEPVGFSGPEKLSVESDCDHASMSRTGTTLAYAHDGRIHVLGREQSLAGWPAFQYVEVSPDGRWVAASAFAPDAAVRLWESGSGTLIREFSSHGPADIAFSPDNRWLVTGGPGEYCFWDVNSCELKHRLPRPDNFHGMIAFSPDQQIVAVVRSLTQVQLLSSTTLQELARLESPVPQLISSLAFSPSGNQLAVATETPFIQLWDLRWLRQQLANLGLDWDSVPSTDSRAAAPKPAAGASVSVFDDSRTLGHSQFLAVTAGGVLLAVVLAIFVLRRHHRLVISYQRLDDVALERAHELQAAHNELLHSQKMKALGTLAAGIAHDFNNLLSIVRLSNDLIGRETRALPGVQEEVTSIENAVREGKAVVRSMLGYSREVDEKPVQFEVADVVGETVSLLSKEFLGGIVLTLDVDKDGLSVWGVPSRLEQVLLNLIVNAAEAMKGEGKLLIRAGRSERGDLPGVILAPAPSRSYVEVRVADSGPGIEPDILPRIFEPFFTTKVVGSKRGTGLGLSLAYTIAQQDRLGLGVETAVGKGTTFRILLPAGGDGGSFEV